MSHFRARSAPIWSGLALLCAAALPSAAQTPTFESVIAHEGIKLDSAAHAALDRGDVITRVLVTRERTDVAVLGIVRVNVPRASYLRRVQQFSTWLGSPTRTRRGIFSDPAVQRDVEGVSVTRQDANDLRKCRPGDCVTKLPAVAMQRLRDDVDWNASDLQSRLSALARERLVEFVAEYRARGNAAMPTYDDRPVTGTSSSDAFRALLESPGSLSESAPSLAAYLLSFPSGRPAGVSDVLFWSEDVVPRLRPILSVSHLVVFTPPEVGGLSLVVTKQLYANHYFEAALELLSVADRDAGGASGSIWLVSERRYRFDGMPRGFGDARGKAVNGLQQQLHEDLMREKVVSERAAGARTPE